MAIAERGQQLPGMLGCAWRFAASRGDAGCLGGCRVLRGHGVLGGCGMLGGHGVLG